MPDRLVTLPTPEQERKAVLALIAFGLLAIFGAAATIAAVGVALTKLTIWVFS